MLINLLVFCMKFIQNSNKLISILYQIDTEYLFVLGLQ